MKRTRAGLLRSLDRALRVVELRALVGELDAFTRASERATRLALRLLATEAR